MLGLVLISSICKPQPSSRLQSLYSFEIPPFRKSTSPAPTLTELPRKEFSQDSLSHAQSCKQPVATAVLVLMSPASAPAGRGPHCCPCDTDFTSTQKRRVWESGKPTRLILLNSQVIRLCPYAKAWWSDLDPDGRIRRQTSISSSSDRHKPSVTLPLFFCVFLSIYSLINL